jgi:hypothetical protein
MTYSVSGAKGEEPEVILNLRIAAKKYPYHKENRAGIAAFAAMRWTNYCIVTG